MWSISIKDGYHRFSFYVCADLSGITVPQDTQNAIARYATQAEAENARIAYGNRTGLWGEVVPAPR